MEATVSHSIMPQKSISSKHKTVIKKYPFCLGNISGEFLANNIKKRIGLNGCEYNYFVDYRAFDTTNSKNIHK